MQSVILRYSSYSSSLVYLKLPNHLNNLLKQKHRSLLINKQFHTNKRLNCNLIEINSSKSKPNRFKMDQEYNYPIARKDLSIIEDFHGQKVADPYRWLEDPDAEETKKFVEEQNKISQPYLESTDQWKLINEKLTKLWNYPKFTCPSKHGDKYYFYMNTGLQNQNVLYQQKSLTDEPVVFLDPNQLSDDGTIALTKTSFSEDGKLFAYGLSESGSDWIKIKIRNVETGIDYNEILEKVKFSSIAWTKDNKGLFYARYPDQTGKTDGSETVSNENQKLYYHRIGEAQNNDILVVEFPEEPTWRIQAEVSHCGKYLILSIVKDCRDNLIFFADLKETGNIDQKLAITQIIHKFESDYEYITNVDNNIIFRTNKNAPNYQLITIDFNNPEEKYWKVLIKENTNDVLDWADCVYHDKLVLGYIHDVKSELKVYNLNTGDFVYQFPLDIGTIVDFSGKKKHSEVFYQFVSFLQPGIIYHYDFADKEPTIKVFREIKLNIPNFDINNYKIEQIFYNSKDNVKVPMFIVQKKSKPIDKETFKPCLLYGYGGFNISIQPTFSTSGLLFINLFDGILAYPNIRGGGEYGEKWHNSGRLLNKQNVFDDFQYAAKYLIDNKITEKNKLIIQGASNGGLLIAACINQRPDLFGAAVAQVGVMDMLRFHKFTIGHAWTSDYGDPIDKDHFLNMYNYSPLHNVKTPNNDKDEYPAALILTGDHDDRVSPLHSLKYAAALHEAIRKSKIQKRPLLLRVYSKAGHGAGKPTTKKIEENTDILTFAYKTLNLTIHE